MDMNNIPISLNKFSDANARSILQNLQNNNPNMNISPNAINLCPKETKPGICHSEIIKQLNKRKQLAETNITSLSSYDTVLEKSESPTHSPEQELKNSEFMFDFMNNSIVALGTRLSSETKKLKLSLDDNINEFCKNRGNMNVHFLMAVD